jgi:RHS repeat-associated protein
MNGQSAVTIRVPLPGGSTAELLGATAGVRHILHSDWLGSARLSTTYTDQSVANDTAYAPYGEAYGGSSTDLNFTGQSQDTLSGLYDFLYREYSPVQGRWISPDPSGVAAVDPTNPQSWNRYAYVLNNPLSFVDPTGLDCAYLNDPGTGVDDSGIDHDSNQGECWSNGGYWADGYIGDNSWVQTFSNSDNVIIDSNVNGFLVQTLAGSLNNGASAFSQMFSLNASVDTILSNPYTPTNYVDPMAPSARQTLRAIANAAPTLCGGGVFLYGGPAVKNQAETAEGAFQGFFEWDSNSGFGSGAVAEGQIGPVGGGVLVQEGQPLDPFVFAGEGAGTIAFESGSVGVYAGTPYVGGGVYANVTTNAGCSQKHQ